MKITHTHDSPILLIITPETPSDIFKNGIMFKSLTNMEIPCKFRKDGAIILNIDSQWKDFTLHSDKHSPLLSMSDVE